jgi:radical SAM superfamily enzyme YgiQ (UPF0313 family)
MSDQGSKIKKNIGWNKIYTLKKINPKPIKEDDYDAKHQKVLDALKPYARAKPQSNLTEVKIENVTRKTSIAFLLLPEWAINFPPYNVARLAAVTKNAGYKTHAFDLNVKAFRDYKNWAGIDFDPWDGAREWKWMKESYYTELHHYVQPFMERYIEKLVDLNPTVIGFSLYYCNEEPTKWMARELKKRMPNLTIMVGGPQCHQSYWEPIPEYDYIIRGEGEELLLEALEEIEANGKPTEQKWFKQQDGQRLDLDKLPMPDYSHFDFIDYAMPNGVNAEISRGCTAKCVFCSETHFWKYRGRAARSILDEVAELYYNKGVDVFWFLDSLVNGNLNELRAFCKGVIAREMKIHWTGYARHDKRMDLDYYKDLSASGCINLSYGIESGSNKVLADMDKGVTVDEIEQNLKDGASVDVDAFSNWIIGFPTEKPQDFYETMMLIWRNRNYLMQISAGHGFTIPPDTIIAQDVDRYGIAKSFFEGNWITTNYDNSKVHRLIRLKTFNIFLNNLINSNNNDFSNRRSIDKDYTLTIHNDSPKEIEFETFDFNICNPEISSFANSLVNEVWPLLRLFWRTRGAYNIDLIFDSAGDMKEFGERMGCNFNASIKFNIDTEGKWTADFNFDFKQSNNPWAYQEYSRADSTAAMRARKLAIPGSGGETQFTFQSYDEEIVRLEERKKMDLSFTYAFKQEGQW